MKQIRIFLFALLCTFLALPAMAQEGKGIQFFKGTFAQALAKAKAEGKPLFVDFYAVWCGPCKKMEKQIFTQPEVGEYFNKHFVALQLDAEKPENVDVAKTYKVEAFPTLGIFDGEGKALSINVGYMNAQELMAMAKTAVGEVKGFEQLYKEYRQNPNDFTIQQDLLTLAPQFLTTQDGMDAEKWVVRVRKIYQAYIEKKMSDNSLINRKDYVIIGYLGGDDEESTYRLVDYISNNMDAWMAAVGEPAAYYVVEKNDERMLKLVKKGDESYKTYLEKIRTDYKKAYDVIKFTSATPYDKSRDYYNALFAIYKNPSEKVLMNKINYLVMVGDSYRELKKYKEAEQYYKQAYGESLQMGELEQAQQMIQASVLHKLSTLELLMR